MKKYVMPIVSVTRFDSEDIITASGDTNSALESVVSDGSAVAKASYNSILNAAGESYTID